MGLLNWRKKRPLHLGRFPMEKIKRVEQPTTSITDRVPRVPQRANFFVRAAFGDLGQRAHNEVRRFVPKVPLSRAIVAVSNALRPLTRGEPSAEKAPLTEDRQAMSDHIKATCYYLDADIVGICEVPPYAWYSHDLEGRSIEPEHPYAVVLLIDQGYETMAGSSGDDWISAAQSMRAYNKGSVIAVAVADYIRQLGFEARAHTNFDSAVNHVPLALLAGLGELSRIGEVVLNPFLGPRFKTAVVTTSLPLATDKPIDFGLQDFCRQCLKCARECPCNAVSFGDKVMFNGYEMWKPDVEACARYRIMNPAGSACGRCLKVCPFNKPARMRYRLAMWLAIKLPSARRLLIWLDDALQFGQRVPVWKWWLDLEWRDGRLAKPAKTNQRDLRPERQPPPLPNIFYYPADSVPPPDAKEPYPARRTPTGKRPGSDRRK